MYRLWGHSTRKSWSDIRERVEKFPLSCPQMKTPRVKEEPCVHVGGRFAYNVLHSRTITPPMLRIIIRIWNCDDAYGDFINKSFLKKEARRRA